MSVLSSLVLSLVRDEVICFDKRNPLDYSCSLKTHEFSLRRGDNVAMDVTSVGKSIDLDTLYEEITNDSGTWFRCLICFRTLSRKQRIESHLSSIHGQGKCR